MSADTEAKYAAAKAAYETAAEAAETAYRAHGRAADACRRARIAYHLALADRRAARTQP